MSPPSASGLSSLAGFGGSAGFAGAGSGCADCDCAAAVPAAAAAGRLRIDSLVTASTNARASAPRPISCAPTTGAPSGAEVFATVWVLAFCSPALLVAGSADGESAGNSDAAFPPGLSAELGLCR